MVGLGRQGGMWLPEHIGKQLDLPFSPHVPPCRDLGSPAATAPRGVAKAQSSPENPPGITPSHPGRRKASGPGKASLKGKLLWSGGGLLSRKRVVGECWEQPEGLTPP